MASNANVREQTEALKQEAADWIQDKLQMKLSAEKALFFKIFHAALPIADGLALGFEMTTPHKLK